MTRKDIERKYLIWCKGVNEHQAKRGFRRPPTPQFQSNGLIVGAFAYDLISELIDVRGRQQYICDLLGGLWFNEYGRVHQNGWINKIDALNYLYQVYDLGLEMAAKEK